MRRRLRARRRVAGSARTTPASADATAPAFTIDEHEPDSRRNERLGRARARHAGSAGVLEMPPEPTTPEMAVEDFAENAMEARRGCAGNRAVRGAEDSRERERCAMAAMRARGMIAAIRPRREAGKRAARAMRRR
jgi:hypothetical protein